MGPVPVGTRPYTSRIRRRSNGRIVNSELHRVARESQGASHKHSRRMGLYLGVVPRLWASSQVTRRQIPGQRNANQSGSWNRA